MKTRFSKFNNQDELKAMFREFADVQTAEMLQLEVPEAEYHTVVLDRSEFQEEMMASFLERAEAVRSGGVDAFRWCRSTNTSRNLPLRSCTN